MMIYINGLIRHGLTTFGGAYVAEGIITGDEVTTVISAVVILVGVALSVLAKKLNK